MQSVSGVQILLLMVFLISLASKSCGFLSPSSSFSLRRLDFPIPRSNVLVAKVAVNHNVDDQRRAGGISVSGYEDVEMVDLPQLTPRELAQLSRGERIQKQSRTGRSGYGMVVVDVPAEESLVFQTLCSFERYAELIPTIRAARVSRQSDKVVRAEYSLSKFMLRVNIQHTILPEQHLVKFSLDGSRTNLALQRADGFWYTEPVPNHPQKTRVWLSASILASKLMPSFILDYAAYKALPRATTWLQPYFAGTPEKPPLLDFC